MVANDFGGDSMGIISTLFNTEKLDEVLSNIDGISQSADEIGLALNGIIEVVKITNILIVVLIVAILVNAFVAWKKR